MTRLYIDAIIVSIYCLHLFLGLNIFDTYNVDQFIYEGIAAAFYSIAWLSTFGTETV